MNFRGYILQQYLDKVTLDKGRFSLKFFLHFVFTKQKLGMLFKISNLKSKKYLKSKLEMIVLL